MKPLRSAAGNRFAIWCTWSDGTWERAAAEAAAICAAERTDGVIALGPPERGGDARVVFFNADGSRPEACGNGLRAAARFLREAGRVARDELALETDAGPRAARVLRESGVGSSIVAAEVSVGAGRVAGDVELALADGSRVLVACVELANPHAVVFVPDVLEAQVASLGPAIELHAHFPARVNVGFASRGPEGLALRVWERGVGETEACGTGAVAAALAAERAGMLHLPVAVRQAGGVLRVARSASGELLLTGPC